MLLKTLVLIWSQNPMFLCIWQMLHTILEKEMATHSSTLAWKVPWMEEPVVYSSWGCKELDMISLVAQVVKNSPAMRRWGRPPCNEGDLGSIPGLGRSPGEGKGYTLQYSGPENSMDCIVHGVTESQIRPSNFHFTFIFILYKHLEIHKAY